MPNLSLNKNNEISVIRAHYTKKKFFAMLKNSNIRDNWRRKQMELYSQQLKDAGLLNQNSRY